ncbi:MAG: DUF4922 domain-containing protein [Muribaculaceae bacterium]|nr:DUF4922 domain-containing protein [Muribaculaceae bacterium]
MNTDTFIAQQLESWPLARRNHEALSGIEERTLNIDGYTYRLQHNPARAVSSGAKVDAASVAARPCFLCAANRPPEQTSIAVGEYDILVNPFPIFPNHLTIAHTKHTPQSIAGRLCHMMALAYELEGFTVFYNGPCCGASAPDHQHFQAVPSKYLPIWEWNDAPFAVTTLHGNDFAILTQQFEAATGAGDNDAEPPINVLCRRAANNDISIKIIHRRAHRPTVYPRMMVSPGAIDMAGVLVLPVKADFENMSAQLLRQILDDVAYREEPEVHVGIMSAPEITVTFNGLYTDQYGHTSEGRCMFTASDAGRILHPVTPESTFTLHDVTIGCGFHWQRHENQTFEGKLHIKSNKSGITAINSVKIERYLRSVISSEMSATSSPELLKAHAVISRSWLLAQMQSTRGITGRYPAVKDPTECGDHVKWYDREDHEGYDVCADDHCQRYQGITRIVSTEVDRAVSSTSGMVLWHNGHLCDARFSKCCGGVMEQFENCWQPTPHPYLQARMDRAQSLPVPDLSIEENAVKWIKESSEAFCNTTDAAVLRQVLNDYDRETPDFYRWRTDYTQDELSALIARRSGMDFGCILALTPRQRGTSGRITLLEIKGTKLTLTVGKELEIRRWLSATHLYSSAFTAEAWAPDADGVPSGFTIYGAGWGHGVGLCQIGAAMMAAQGYNHYEILQHYFPGSQLHQLYKDK